MSTQPTVPSQPQNSVSIPQNVYEALPPVLRNQADQATFKPAEASQDGPGVAGYAYPDDPSTIYLTKLGQNPAANGHPEASEASVVGHEAFHNLEANMPPTQQKMTPQSDEYGKDLSNAENNEDVYGIDDIDDLRKQGKTITTIPNEKGAAIVQAYINSGGSDKKLQPWIDDLANVKQSVIMPTLPGQKGINTEPRAPGPPVEMAESEVHNPPPAKAAPKKSESVKQSAKPVEKKPLTTSAKKVYNSTKSALGGS